MEQQTDIAGQPGEAVELSVQEALGLAVRCQRTGDLDGAERLYGAVLELVPEHVDALHFLGILAHQRGQSERGIELIRRALARAPGSAGMLNNLGNILYELDRFDEAAAAYEDAIGITPDAGTYNNLGATRRMQGRFDDARAAYEHALELDPRHASAHHNLGNLLASRGRLRDAVEHYCTALVLRPSDAAVSRQLGIAYSILGRDDEAAAIYRDWLAREPDNAVARHMLAACSKEAVPERASDTCIVQMFDAFASTFDAKLAKLGYRAPELCLLAVTAAVGQPSKHLVVLDAGCGTGLCGPLLAPFARHLTGVDLSGRMLSKARTGGGYDELVQAELTSYLERSRGRFDLIVSADTLVYFGALEAVSRAAAGALRPGGVIVFSVERAPAGSTSPVGHHLDSHGRYRHAPEYVRRTLEASGFSLLAMEAGVLRIEAGAPVDGLVVTAKREALAVPSSN
jgi:predicted TPR repeat methyltransferase